MFVQPGVTDASLQDTPGNGASCSARCTLLVAGISRWVSSEQSSAFHAKAAYGFVSVQLITYVGTKQSSLFVHTINIKNLSLLLHSTCPLC